jgi:hypothetical protein
LKGEPTETIETNKMHLVRIGSQMRDRDPNRLPYLGAGSKTLSRENSVSSNDTRSLSKEREKAIE